MADDDYLDYKLDLARTCVHKGEAYQGLAHLKDIQFEIEDLPGTSRWARYQVIYAGALAGLNDPSAETAFEDALKRCGQLSDPDLPLTMTAHEDYAKYLAGRRATNRALQHYREAEKIADALGREECQAHFQMCIIGLQLQATNSPHVPAFQKLQGAAKDGYNEIEQREAWIQYMEQVQGFAPQLVETRHGGQASVDYFRGLLSAVRRGRE